MAGEPKVYVIGVGEEGLDGLAAGTRRLIEEADLVIAEQHAAALVPSLSAERLVIERRLDEAVERIARSPDQRIVVLAVGDPLFYGAARFLCDQLGKDRFEVVPHVSAMQLAFARVKESWEEAFLTNLANHDLEDVLGQVRAAEKVGLFTSQNCPPREVARQLLACGIDWFDAYVCENIGSPDERVTCGQLAEMAEQDFSPLNVMVLVRKPLVPDRPADQIGRRLFGNPDEAFLQSLPKRHLLTPAEVRALVLAELDLGPSSIVWDIGAGTGSVSIEAARIAREGKVFGIEMDPDDYQLLLENAKRFDASNVVPVLGQAPEAWADLPDPDAVFVGGSGPGISRLVEAAYGRLRAGGRLVATMGSIDNIAETHQLLHRHVHDVKVWLMQLSRGTYQFERLRFQSLSPTFVVAVVKPA